VDKITIVSTGNGDSAGMHKITGDMAQMAAQVPALFEALSGMKMNELLGKVRQIGDNGPSPMLRLREVGRRRQISGPNRQLLNNGKLPARKFHATDAGRRWRWPTCVFTCRSWFSISEGDLLQHLLRVSALSDQVVSIRTGTNVATRSNSAMMYPFHSCCMKLPGRQFSVI